MVNYYSVEPLIFKLPNELLFQIQSLLPLASQACLALSCKIFLELFKSVLSDKELRFPHISYRYEGDLAPSYNTLTTARWELLLQIEDGRWLYCSRCIKLHPIGEFPAYERRNSPIMRRCMSFAGVVELMGIQF
ncbi:hypothetical protein VTN77DRAFT_3464 [Rasamsonia byssochlamydoides]|uniref:uncharacterized protein n=1 Tax=Rasamsonia byssochlamydoides TaxID=89139 RepID=UPI0037448FCB